MKMKKLVCAIAVGLLTSAGAFAQVANVKSAEKIASSDKPDSPKLAASSPKLSLTMRRRMTPIRGM